MTWSTLHEACKHNDTDAIIQLANRNDDAFQTDDHGATPLHLLCLNDPDIVALKSLVEANHMAVSDRDMNGDTPLHLLCRNSDCTRASVEILVEANPYVLSVANKHGYLPLHVACTFPTRNHDVLAFLIYSNPYALLHHTKIGELVKKRSSLEGHHANHIIDPNAGLKTVDTIDLRMMQTEEFVRDGGYPLHIAIENGAPLDVVALLTNHVGREFLELTNKFRQTPLMVALSSKAGEDVVRHPLACFPDALHVTDSKGNLPLHVAAQHGATPAVFELLLGQWPTSAVEVNAEGLKASDLALRHGNCSENVTKMLVTLNYQESI